MCFDAFSVDLWHHLATNSNSKAHYNQRDLGWHFGQIETDSTEVLDDLKVSKRWLYDTRKSGYKNTGHQFGDALTKQQRNAVIEYIKTL